MIDVMEYQKVKGKNTSMIPPTVSLLKYDNPVVVTKNTEGKSSKALPLKAGSQPAFSGPVPPPFKPRSSTSAVTEQQRQDILNAVLPPKKWVENDQLWEQQVSSTPCTRADVIHLQEALDLQLQQKQARDMGICAIRRELYAQCFDEIVRQVTINCAERGVLLLRVRDEILMTINAYQTLLETCTAYSIRKALQAEEGMSEMEKKIAEMENEKRELQRQVNEQKAKYETMERRESERRQLEIKKNAEEIERLKRINQQLRAQLDAVVAPKT